MKELEIVTKKLRLVTDALVDFNLRDLEFLRQIHSTVTDKGQITRDEYHAKLDPFLDIVQNDFEELQRKMKEVDDAA